MQLPDRRRLSMLAVVGIPSLAAATIGTAVLESYVGVPNASVLYLTAVVATAIFAGPLGAFVAAVAAFLLYDFLFVEPFYTLTVSDPGEWLNLVLLFFAGAVVGELTALQRSRTIEARSREREARALFQVSRDLVTRHSTPEVLPEIARILRDHSGMDRVWISLGTELRERVAADTDPDKPPGVPGVHRVLLRTPGDAPAKWVRVHAPRERERRITASEGREAYRVKIGSSEATLGSVWALRPRGRGEPDRSENRLLAAGADQVGQALAHDRLRAESRAAEIARQSDELKSALLQSVSHDLRTPLATIRAATGTLRPGSSLSAEDQNESVDAIDREVEYLNRLVTNLLDLSRIEAGALRAERDVFELDDVVGPTIERLQPRLAGRPLEVDLAAKPVDVDPIFVDEAFTNALENSIKYTKAGTVIRVRARDLPGEPYVRLSVDDAGSGVPDETLPRLFEKFYRVPGGLRGSRSGTGIGLAVTRGLIEATGGRAAARRSDLGGLGIDLDLPTAVMAPEVAPEGGTST